MMLLQPQLLLLQLLIASKTTWIHLKGAGKRKMVMRRQRMRMHSVAVVVVATMKGKQQPHVACQPFHIVVTLSCVASSPEDF